MPSRAVSRNVSGDTLMQQHVLAVERVPPLLWKRLQTCWSVFAAEKREGTYVGVIQESMVLKVPMKRNLRLSFLKENLK